MDCHEMLHHLFQDFEQENNILYTTKYNNPILHHSNIIAGILNTTRTHVLPPSRLTGIFK